MIATLFSQDLIEESGLDIHLNLHFSAAQINVFNLRLFQILGILERFAESIHIPDAQGIC